MQPLLILLGMFAFSVTVALWMGERLRRIRAEGELAEARARLRAGGRARATRQRERVAETTARPRGEGNDVKGR